VLTARQVAEAVAGAGIEVPARWLESTGSTNTDVLAMARAGGPEWTVLVADHQAEGRGRLGRAWVAPPGTSLMVSVLLRPSLDPSAAPMLTLAAGLALAEATRSATGLDVGCKWPNDLVVGERKLAGVLAEASVEGGRLDHVVIGAGLNLSQRPEDFPPELRNSATSVAVEGGTPDGAAILRSYLVRLRELFGDGGADLADRTRGPYVERCVTLGRPVSATVADGVEIVGTAEGLTEAGELVVADARSGVRHVIGSGEVTHLR
jgi:BirA family transcriptional regulator, biotin operon repressor / biotin---[acetyl-CoA-carboxylase] ligase